MSGSINPIPKEFEAYAFVASHGNGPLKRLGDNAIPLRLDLLRIAMEARKGESPNPGDLIEFALGLEPYVMGEIAKPVPKPKIIGGLND